MTAAERLAGEITKIVYSGLGREEVLARVSRRIRAILDAHMAASPAAEEMPEVWLSTGEEKPCPGKPAGFATGICPTTGRPCLGALVGHPGHFYAGHRLGAAIRDALAGRLTSEQFRKIAEDLFHRPIVSA